MMQYINRKTLEENENIKEIQKKKVLIIGAGMIGISSAFVLSKLNQYDVTVIDKHYPINGASEQNANTITLESYDAFMGNIYGYFKDNLTFKSPRKCKIMFRSIFDKQFRFWLKGFLSNTTQAKIKHSNAANIEICHVTYQLIDEVIKEVTNNSPDLVDFHKDFFLEIGTGSNAKIKALEAEAAFLRQYDKEYELFHKDRLTKYSDVNFGLNCPIKVLNTAKFCALAKSYVESNGVTFLQGTVNAVEHDGSKISSVEYIDQSQRQHRLDKFDEFVFCDGIDSIGLGKLVGLRVPMYGFKGYSFNVYVDHKDMLDTSLVFIDKGIAVCRVGKNTSGMIRFTGYADLMGLDYTFHDFRKTYMVNFAKQLLGEHYFDAAKANFWVGLRPVTSDDVAIVGRSSRLQNLYWNTGHGCRGISSSIGSALLLSHAMNGSMLPERLNPDVYLPKRFEL